MPPTILGVMAPGAREAPCGPASVYLLRYPAGEWVALEASTTAADGIGLADTTLHDEQGPIGRSAQALFVDRR